MSFFILFSFSVFFRREMKDHLGWHLAVRQGHPTTAMNKDIVGTGAYNSEKQI